MVLAEALDAANMMASSNAYAILQVVCDLANPGYPVYSLHFVLDILHGVNASLSNEYEFKIENYTDRLKERGKVLRKLLCTPPNPRSALRQSLVSKRRFIDFKSFRVLVHVVSIPRVQWSAERKFGGIKNK